VFFPKLRYELVVYSYGCYCYSTMAVIDYFFKAGLKVLGWCRCLIYKHIWTNRKECRL